MTESLIRRLHHPAGRRMKVRGDGDWEARPLAAGADRIEWLLREGGDERKVQVTDRIVIDDDYWRAVIERFDPADDLRVYLSTAEVRQSPSFEAHHTRPGAWLIGDIAVKGTCAISFIDGPSVEITPARSVFFRPAGRRGIFTPPARQTLRIAGYVAREDRVRRMLGDDLPDFVADMIGEDGATRIVEAPASERLRRLAASLFNEAILGPLRLIFMEGVALQMLALQVMAVSAGKRRKNQDQLTLAQRDAVTDARAELFANIADPPGIGALAIAAGMSERALNAGFRALFGGTIYEVLRDERLARARLVLEKSDAPIKQIAYRVGYSQVSNFTAAFTRRYGEPPARYARFRTQEDEHSGE
jgi:AraC-like DNA-binding protein